jgi:hypothetical protein
MVTTCHTDVMFMNAGNLSKFKIQQLSYIVSAMMISPDRASPQVSQLFGTGAKLFKPVGVDRCA